MNTTLLRKSPSGPIPRGMPLARGLSVLEWDKELQDWFVESVPRMRVVGPYLGAITPFMLAPGETAPIVVSNASIFVPVDFSLANLNSPFFAGFASGYPSNSTIFLRNSWVSNAALGEVTIIVEAIDFYEQDTEGFNLIVFEAAA